MKKLMVAAAAAVLGIAANAANFDWSAGEIGWYEDPYDYMEGSVARIFAVDVISATDLAKELADGDFSSWNSDGMVEKTINAGGAAVVDGYAGELAAGEHTFYAVILDTGSTDTATSFYMTQTVTKTLKDGEGNETQVAFGDQYDTYESSGWTAIQTVPEPTSGLLLLLGVAGLALRRRRA